MKSQIINDQDIKRLGTILSVWAHPDDETYSCAGIMATAAANGQRVICITATKGEAGIQDETRWPAEHLGEIRTKELETALRALGVHDHKWLGYTDGGCQQADPAAAAEKLLDIFNDIEPDSILTFGSDGITGHPDHITISKWVDLALKDYKQPVRLYHVTETKEQYDKYLKDLDAKFNIYFNIDKPRLVAQSQCDICYCLPTKTIDKKLAAFKAMPSQTEGLIKYLGEDRFHQAFSHESFIRVR